MSMVKLGNTDLEVSEIAFGAWAIGGWMWGGNDDMDSRRALDIAIDHGITTIDTAPVYGFGKSESLVGNAIQGKRDKVQILTKYGLRWDAELGEYYFSTSMNDGTPVNIHRYSGKDSIIKECEDSLQRLQTDYIDLYQIHWPDPTTPVEETMEALRTLIQQGKVRTAGVCNYNAEDLGKASSVLPIASNQVSYSMVKRDIEEETIPYCIENNIGIMVYSPLQRGILGGKIHPDHRFRRGDNRPDTPYYKLGNIIRINEFLDNIRPIAENREVSLSQLVLRWTLQQPGIACLLAGVRNEEQLAENAATLHFELAPSEMEIINQHLENLELILDE
jgi:aryl-alcohol dehydrogenase-like predicted oxidoreductase